MYKGPCAGRGSEELQELLIVGKPSSVWLKECTIITAYRALNRPASMTAEAVR
jgi:hypothetical protein